MDFELNEFQTMLRDAARRLLTSQCSTRFVREAVKSEAGYSEELWREMTGLGWLTLIMPADQGGEGGSLMDLRVLMEELGRVCLPSPFLDTISGILFLIAAGAAKELPGRLAKGEEIIASGLNQVSLDLDSYCPSLVAEETGGGYIIRGTESPVAYANVADEILCLCRAGNGNHDWSLFLVDAGTAGLEINGINSIGRKQFRVDFNEVKVSRDCLLGKPNGAAGLLNRVLPRIIALKCAELAGGAQQVVQMTVDYSRERVASGHHIGSFQAIQHHCANMFIWSEGARLLSQQALSLLDQGLPCRNEAAITKAFLNKFYWQICLLAHQVNGAVAFCEDHALGLYTQEAKTSEHLFGRQAAYLDVIFQNMAQPLARI